jgi:flagellar biosynthesis GTPase FlhF
MCACQNLDAHYGQKKIAVPNRRQERQRQAGQRQQQAQAKRVATARRKIEDYTQRLTDWEEQVRQQRATTQTEVQALRQASQEAATAKQREKLLVQAERRAAQGRMQQLRQQQKQRRWQAQQRAWERKLAELLAPSKPVLSPPPRVEDPPFYDFDLEKDDLMTYLRLAGENAHRFVQEHYFAATLLEKVDEETMVRVIYHQPGWIQRRNSSLQVQLQGYRDPKVQAAVVQACHFVNQAQVQLPSGHRLHMEVRTKIIDL